MAIEQAIFTCCRARRDVGTTGFGYYSVTAGMDELRKNSAELSMLSSSYSAPRNQELWWSSSPDEAQRNASEKAAIAEHHPISFGYRLIEIDGREKAVFTFGKNLGRDIQGTRPGNIMVNTVAADLSDVAVYPFEYFDCPEIFVGYDRDFFVNAPDTPAPDLVRPEALTAVGSVTRKMAEEFLAQDSRRADLLVSMLQFVLDYNDPDQVTRQVMICDRKENIILWTAALSLCFPREIAKRFSFCTYSFLGSNDSGTVSIEPTMLCGVYSASINGDPEDRRATNYDFDLEAERIESALFDFERGFFTEAEPRCPGFMMILRGALMGGYDQLSDYHRFIMEETSCRAIDNDFAKGCCYYLIRKFKNQVSLSYLADAAAFARKYMDAAALRQLLETAFGCTLEQGEMSGSFSEIMSLSSACIEAGAVGKDYVYGVCIGFLRNAFLEQSLSRDEYLEAKQGIKGIFDGCGDSFEQAFADALTAGGLTEMIPSITKKWILLELAELLCRRAAEGGGTDVICGSGSDAQLLRAVVGRAVESEEQSRAELIGVFGGMFPDDAQRLCLADSLIAELGEGSEAYSDLVGCIASVAVGGSGREAAAIAADKPYKRQFFAVCTSRLLAEGSFEKAEKLFGEMTSGEISGGYSEYYTDMTAVMLSLADPDKKDAEAAAAEVFRTFEFAKANGALDGTADSISAAFVKAVVSSCAWFALDEASGKMLDEMVSGGCAGFFLNNGVARNMLIMRYAAESADTPKTKPPVSAEDMGTLDLSLIPKEDLPEVCELLAEFFAKRSIDSGSALSEAEGLFIGSGTNDERAALRDTLERAVRAAAKLSPKEQRAKLTAETLTILSVLCKTDLKSAGEELYELKVKLDDVCEAFESKEILKFVKEHGGNESRIKGMTAELAEGYDSKKHGGVFGRLRSRFGKGKNG